MPKEKLEYCILLSTPSDLTDERSAVEEIISELSATWGRANDATLRLLSWEKDVAPSFASEAQEVINQSFDDDWDVYLGIMHIRFGTPTKRYGSGTEEEFERAYKLWSSKGSGRALMFYFKNGAVVPDDIDVGQLLKVRSFKEKVSALGGLYGEFDDLEAFKNLLRIHIAKVLYDLHKNCSLSKCLVDKSPTVTDSDTADGEDEDSGLLDFMESFLGGMDVMTNSIQKISMAMDKTTNTLRECQIDIQNASRCGNVTAMRKVITKLSKDMLATAKDIADTRREYSAVSKPALESFSCAISLARSFAGQEIPDQGKMINSVSEVMDTIESFIKGMIGTERAMMGVPNIARAFGAARSILRNEFISLRRELNTTLGFFRELKNILEDD